MKTVIKLKDGIEMQVECPRALLVEEIQEIENLDLAILWSDNLAKHWSFDTKLESTNKWLEGIYYTNELDKCTALICI